ncbi:MAG: YafY family protein [Vulcanimicrobiota bacterium]
MNRASRIFALHESLSRGAPPRSAKSWGRVFGVNARTVLRDLAFLKQELQAPLIFDPCLGGYRYLQTNNPIMFEDKLSKWARLLALIHRIYAQPGMTAEKLAEETGCVPRTIRRDIAELQKVGLPVDNHNGYRFSTDAFLPSLTLSGTEIFALFVAVRLMESQNPGELAGEARGGLEKLLRATPETRRLDFGELREAIHVSETAEDTGTHHLADMQKALSSGRQLELEYQGMKDEMARKRVLDPMGLFCFHTVWYLHAYDHKRQGLRNFRLSRVSGARLLETPVSYRPRMELDEVAYHKWDVEGDQKVDVVIKVSPSLGRWLEENPAHPSQLLENGQARYRVSNPLAMTRWVTSLYGLEVMEPAILRTELQKVSQELFELYGE